MKALPLRAALALAAFTLAPGPALAANPLNADTAWQIIQGCVAQSKPKNQSHAIAVYDGGGHPIALLRMDGNQPGVTDFAMQKAEAAALWHFSTANMDDAAKETPGFARAPHVVTVPGGLPFFSADGTQFLGAVGVSGEAPADDVACAEAGVKAAGFALVRKR